MSKELEAWEEIKDAMLEWTEGYEENFDIIEKGLKELEERREMMKRFNEACVPIILDNETQKKLKALEIVKDICELKVFKNKFGQCFLIGTYISFAIPQETYDTLKEALL